ncbi:MAG: SgcJ/EcaC family oxidoreductase [Saprospiraceae bacterium]|nr:SgcJ/EcaC family oxidoreductase [Saprospiraceae bacterium]
MRSSQLLLALSFCLMVQTSCKQEAKMEETKAAEVQAAPEVNLSTIKAEIQALEDEWEVAANTKNAAAVLDFYTEDAVSFSNNQAMLVGKEAIKKDIEASFAKQLDGSIATYETLDVFGDENLVTETGKTTVTDAKGKVIYTGKYMAIWQKQDGKWKTIRDIYNSDVKEK